jgi:hypothetical protein
MIAGTTASVKTKKLPDQPAPCLLGGDKTLRNSNRPSKKIVELP